jgi:hypothetical protein
VASSDAFIELDAGLRGLDLVALNEGDAACVLEVHEHAKLPLLEHVVSSIEDRDLKGGRGRGGGAVGRFVAGGADSVSGLL